MLYSNICQKMIFFIYALLRLAFVKTEIDPGFDLFFGTNSVELENEEIFFENPLPHWLRGTLVSIQYK